MHYLDRLQMLTEIQIRLTLMELDLLKRQQAETAPRADSLRSNFMGQSEGLQGLRADFLRPSAQSAPRG